MGFHLPPSCFAVALAAAAVLCSPVGCADSLVGVDDDAILVRRGLERQEQCHDEGIFMMQRRALSRERAAKLPTVVADQDAGGEQLSTDQTEAVGGTQDVLGEEANGSSKASANGTDGNATVVKEAKKAVVAAAKAASKGPRDRPHAEQAAQEAVAKVKELPPGGRWKIWRDVYVGRQEERRRTAISCSLLPLGSSTAIILMAFWFLRGHVRRNEAPQATRSIYLVVNFVLVLNYTIVILDSYDLCATLGLSKGASGRMVGTYMLGFCLGSFASWLAVRRRPLLWREAPRSLIVAGLLCQLAGSVAYCSVALKATDAAGKAADLPLVGIAKVLFGLRDSPWLSHLMMFSRFVSGMGSGTCQQFYVSSMLHLTPVSERSEHTSRWVFSGMLAIGLGPMVAAAVQALDLCGRWPRFELVGHVQIVAVVAALASVLLLHPALTEVQDFLEPRRGEGGEAEDRDLQRGRKALVCGCLAMTGLRAFGVSAIEVVIALKLEETYLWDQRVTGLVIGGIFLCCIPLKVLHSVLGKSMTVVGWIRLLSSFSIVGSMLLFNVACKVMKLGGCFNSCAYVLILAGTVLFPCFYLSDALGSGLMHQHVLPEGSWLDANHAQLWYNLCQGLGRFLGPWLARLSIQLRGQDTFAMEQLAVTCAFLLGFEFIVRPFIMPRAMGGPDRKTEEVPMAAERTS